MSVQIIPVLRKRRRPWLDRHPAWQAAFIIVALVLFVLAAAFPAEGRHKTRPVSTCSFESLIEPPQLPSRTAP